MASICVLLGKKSGKSPEASSTAKRISWLKWKLISHFLNIAGYLLQNCFSILCGGCFFLYIADPKS
ncbi:unnamed protein product [Larinioides sclopetarius]|uniref:Uncharacterized protein n=1 Tax=Larinioides sclopetarius TaxID=280406 RepID=A0AAV2A8E5_9ARAC